MTDPFSGYDLVNKVSQLLNWENLHSRGTSKQNIFIVCYFLINPFPDGEAMQQLTSSRTWNIYRDLTGSGRSWSRTGRRPTRTTWASVSTGWRRRRWACWRPSGAANTTDTTASPRTPSSSAPRASHISQRSFSLIYTNHRWVKWECFELFKITE